MLSSLWNQITQTDDDSSDSSNESSSLQPPAAALSKSSHLHHSNSNNNNNQTSTQLNADDITADQLLSSFPPFGTFSGNSNVNGQSSVAASLDDLSHGSSTVNSNNANNGGNRGNAIVGAGSNVSGGGYNSNNSNIMNDHHSEWENFSPRRHHHHNNNNGNKQSRRKKNVIGSSRSNHRNNNIDDDDDEDDNDSIDQTSYVKTMMNVTTPNDTKRNQREGMVGAAALDDNSSTLINNWSDEEMNIWTIKNGTFRKSQHSGGVNSSSLSKQKSTHQKKKNHRNHHSRRSTSKKSRRRRSQFHPTNQMNHGNHQQQQQYQNTSKNNQNQYEYNPSNGHYSNQSNNEENIPSSIYWNNEFRQKWIHSTTSTPSTPKNNDEFKNNNNNNNKQQSSNDYSKSDGYLHNIEEDFSLIRAKNPCSIKIGKHFTFDFDEQESLTESSYTGSYDDYDDDDDDDVEYNEYNFEDDDDDNMNGMKKESKNDTATTTASTTTKTSDTKSTSTSKDHQNDNKIFMKHYNEKSHWMPDQLCKHCYACEEKFTVFRRRHHCRLCGQVFCNSCSSCFVEIVDGDGDNAGGGGGGDSTTDGGDGGGGSSVGDGNSTRTVSIRTCKLCYEQVSSSGPNGVIWDGSSGQMEKKDSINNLGNVDSKSSKNRNYDDKANNSLVGGFQGGSTSSGGGEFNNLKMVKEKLESDRVKREELQKSRDEELLRKKEDDNPVGYISKTISSTLTRRFGRLAESAAREAQIGDTGYNDEETKLVGTGVKNKEEEDKKEQHDWKGKGTLLDKSRRPPSLEREVSDALTEQSLIDEEKALKEASLQLSETASNHLTKLGKDLLRTDAPLLLKEKRLVGSEGQKELESWVSKLIALTTRCSTAVRPDVRNGDMLDIRPYCKIKVIPGGDLEDSTFVSGVIFHKNVSHKSMAKEIINPRIMLLNNSIEYTRENRILTLETLMEQETRYFQILITKISKMKPDILLVKGSVSRKAQELLMETNIVLLQNVKLSLLEKISRQTGATILSNTEHVMNQFDTSVLGRCRRFRLVSFLDNDIWNNRKDTISQELRLSKRNDAETIQQFMGDFNDNEQLEAQLTQASLANHQRQAVLAAGVLGESHHDGSEAVQCGIAKRGVTVTYVMIEGCPSHLGCTIVLRGASRPALKQVKRIFQFLVNVSYNLKLETSYFRTRRGKLPDGYRIPKTTVMSSSLCVDFGYPPQGRKIRPWNGGEKDNPQRSLSGKITAFDHQSILISSIWMAGKTQCCPAEVKGISYYSEQDVSLGQFLRDSCFNLTLKCQNPTCKKSVLEHSLSFLHNDGLINITVEEMEDPIPSPTKKVKPDSSSDGNSKNTSRSNSPIATWTYCVPCKSVVTPLTFLDQDTFSFSFGKFLEVFFYNKTVQLNSIEHKESWTMQDSSTLYFGCGRLAARFTYERIRPYGVYLRRYLPFDEDYHKKFTVLELNEIMVSSTDLFEKFHKQIDATKKETRLLFGSPANKPEHLQILISQLNEMEREVIRASGILKEKIVSVNNTFNAYNQGNVAAYSAEGNISSIQETFAYFPWHSRRYLFEIASAWNERLSSIGHALAAMKKLADASQKVTSVGRGDLVQTPIPDSDFDDVKDAMKRLKYLREFYTTNLNINEIDTHSESRRRHKRQTTDEIDDFDNDDEFHGEASNVQEEVEELNYNFSEEVDADVLASRHRYSKAGDKKNSRKSPTNQRNKPPTTRRSSSRSRPREVSHSSSNRSRSQSPSQLQSKAKSVTAGGAVKSALTRLFNRSNKEHDPYVVDLGVMGLGRPKMVPGVGGVVFPVYDDQPSTVIAHSLASPDYASQFRRFAKAEMRGTDENRRRSRGDRDTTTIEDYFAGSNGMDSPSKSSRRSGQRRGTSNPPSLDGKKGIEKRMLVRNKTHIKHSFRDYDEKDNQIAKFVCTTFWATQFQAVRQAFLKESSNEPQSVSYNNSTFGTNAIEKNYVKSLSASLDWAVSGGKSGASFSKTSDERFIVKCISRTELQMFLDCAPAYFEYLSKAFFHGLPSMLAKIVGVYQIGYHNRVTGKRTMEQVAVMQNIFYGRKICRVFDLKGKVRGRFAKQTSQSEDKNSSQSKKKMKRKSMTSGSDTEYSSDDDDGTGMGTSTYRDSDDEEGVTYSVGQEDPSSASTPSESKPAMSTLLDGDFLEFTNGRPLPLTDRAKAAFHMSILNDTLFLSIINVLDYSILVGIDEENNELVVGIIDYMRQYDILKQMERVGKSIPMVVGSEAPTIIQPPLYKQRFINAMERYFMTVPNKWTTI